MAQLRRPAEVAGFGKLGKKSEFGDIHGVSISAI
jgi:hypothetical protein